MANTNKTVDGIQQRLTEYACRLSYTDITPQAVHAAKVRVIDTLGALVAGFFAEPCQISRKLAADMPDPNGASIIGTRMKAPPDLAAFVNGTTARYIELTDNYQWAGSFGGHPSDAVMPLLGVAEHAGSSGRDLITSIILAYEIYTRLSDVFDNMGFDHATFNCLGVAMGSGKLLGLSSQQLAHCISMAIVPNNVLRQVRTGHMSMFKAAASGQAARAGVFAALLARAGMEGPHMPFEGKAGWCDHVALKRFSLDTLGGNGNTFKILDTSIKLRPCGGLSISSALAAEKVGVVRSSGVQKIVVEVYAHAKDRAGTGDHRWNPDSRETADHSIPYIVAAALMDGAVTVRTFDDAHLRDPELRSLMSKVQVVENVEFTKAFKALPQRHCSRVTVVTESGDRLVGESGGEGEDLAAQKSDAQIEEKFRSLTEDLLGARRVNAILKRLWRLEDLQEAAVIPPAFVLG